MKICPVTGRIHRTPRELAQELTRIDGQITVMRHIVATFERFVPVEGRPISEAVGDAWNAAHDAVNALERERSYAEMNPRPMRESDRETYLLVKANID